MADPSSNKSSSSMLMLLLVNGFSPTELSASLGTLKSQTKNLGTHNQRQSYWQAYERIQSDITKHASIDVDGGKLYGLVKYYTTNSDDNNTDDDTSRTEFEPFTKRQRALVQTPKVFMGRHIKLMVDDDDNVGSGKEFFMPWFGDEAEAAYLDITAGEPCLSLDSDRGVSISTRIKRKHCASLPSNLKTIDALQDYVAAGLKPDQSIAWEGHDPPTVTNYNVILTGVWPTNITNHLGGQEGVHVAHTNTTSIHEIYDLFEQRRNTHYIEQAEVLIAKMLVEIHKSKNDAMTSSVHTGSMKDLVCAKRNALLKRVFIDRGKTKFIQNAKQDGGFDVVEVTPREGAEAGTFEEYGSMVFETFYRLDLSIYG